MHFWNHVFLITKLIFSLFYYLTIFFLDKIFANKFFSITNSSLTIVALGLLIIILAIPGFNKPKKPNSFVFLGTEGINSVSIKQDEALQVLIFKESLLKKYKQISQKQYLNLANFSLVGGDKEKADHFLKMARYINPNIDFIE